MESKKLLMQLNMPSGDDYAMLPSTKTFVDGTNYCIEVPTTNTGQVIIIDHTNLPNYFNIDL